VHESFTADNQATYKKKIKKAKKISAFKKKAKKRSSPKE